MDAGEAGLLSASAGRGAAVNFECRVSSVLNRNVKEFGKKHLFDGREDTCWNSEQGTPQWVQVSFEEPVTVGSVRLMFQGGFVGKECRLEVAAKEDAEKGAKASFFTCLSFHPDDTNKAQTFKLEDRVTGSVFRILFQDSTDFFGRVTVYQLDLLP